jgi:hypothetical protein
MVYAHTVTRVTLSGTMFGGAEEWSTGFFLGQEGSDSTAPTQAAADQIRDAWATFFNNALSWVSNHYSFTQVKMAQIDASGHTIDASVIYSYPATTVVGGATSGHHPPQCSLVCTLLSDRPRGKASKGRMYLPGFAGTINGSGKVDWDQVGSISTNLKTFFDSFADDADVPDQLILAAKGTGIDAALNAQNDYVETIRVGDVVDTQRRRRNGLNETYVSKVLL